MFNMGCLEYQNSERSLSKCKRGGIGVPKPRGGGKAGLWDPSRSWVLVGEAGINEL